jgi:hypothetical protein
MHEVNFKMNLFLILNISLYIRLINSTLDPNTNFICRNELITSGATICGQTDTQTDMQYLSSCVNSMHFLMRYLHGCVEFLNVTHTVVIVSLIIVECKFRQNSCEYSFYPYALQLVGPVTSFIASVAGFAKWQPCAHPEPVVHLHSRLRRWFSFNVRPHLSPDLTISKSIHHWSSVL